MPNFYEYPTNYSNGTTVSSASDFFLSYPSYITAGLNVNVLLTFLFVVFFLLGLPFGVSSALAAASFIASMLSLYLWYNGSASIIPAMVFLVIAIATTIIEAVSSR